jgi:predicted dehydrogenase
MGVSTDHQNATPSIALIGCGNIAGGDWPLTPPLTHMAAIQAVGMNVSDVFDIDLEKSKQFAKKWGIQTTHSSLESLLPKKFDLIVIATPPTERLKLLKNIFATKASLNLVIEKPISYDLAETLEIEQLISSHKACVWVPYIRSWVPGIEKWKQKNHSGELGDFLGGSAIYTKGLHNNGQHLISLLLEFTPEPTSVSVSGKVEDERVEDPSFHFQLNYADGKQLQVTAIDHRVLSHIEVNLFYSNGRLRINESGRIISWTPKQADQFYPGYFSLGEEKTEDTLFNQHFYSFYSKLYSHFNNKHIEESNFSNAVKTSTLINKISSKAIGII